MRQGCAKETELKVDSVLTFKRDLMEYLLTPKNIQILRSFSLVNTLIGFDFDGTLAPIQDDPSKVSIMPDCEQYLKRLALVRPVAIITGRSVDDVKKYLNFTPKYIFGNHGTEGSHTDSELQTIKEIIQNYKTLILKDFQDEFQKLGITLEDKTYSLSLHYRNSPSPQTAESFIFSRLSYFSQARVTTGKMVFNIVPENGTSKGEAFLKLLNEENTSFGFYIGDDDTDEDVFVFKSSRILTVRVGYSSTSKASYFLRDQQEILKVLEILSN